MTILNGIIQTIAGTGEAGYSGDGGPATAAALREPFMCAFDPAGNLVFSESRNYCVRRIDARTGVITTLVGDGQPGYSGDGGPADRARLNEPYSLTVADNGDIYIVDRLNAVVRKVDGATGIITTFAGNGEPGYGGDGGLGTLAQLREPNDCYLDGRGGLLIADIQDQRIRRLDLNTGIITTFAGNGEKVRAGDGLPATQASDPGRPGGLHGRQRQHLHRRAGGQRCPEGWMPRGLCQPWPAPVNAGIPAMAARPSPPPGARPRPSAATPPVT